MEAFQLVLIGLDLVTTILNGVLLWQRKQERQLLSTEKNMSKTSKNLYFLIIGVPLSIFIALPYSMTLPLFLHRGTLILVLLSPFILGFILPWAIEKSLKFLARKQISPQDL